MAVAKRKVAGKRKAAAAPKAAAPTTIQTLLNGQVVGSVPAEGSIGDAAYAIARGNGLKSYAILCDGVKVTSEGASQPLKGHTSIEVFAKETRG
jgi:hypothetical protein